MNRSEEMALRATPLETRIAYVLSKYGYLVVRAYEQFQVGSKFRKIIWPQVIEGKKTSVELDGLKVIGVATFAEFRQQSIDGGWGGTFTNDNDSKAPYYYKVVEQ